MQTTIPTQFIKEFQRKARFIKGRNVLPIVNYLLFQFGADISLKKTSIDAYVEVSTGNDTPNAMLIEESKLYEIASSTTQETIIISHDNNTVTLKAGAITRKHQVPNVNQFPNMPVVEGEPYEIDGDTIDAIQTAAKFMCTDESDLREWMKHVHLNQWGVQSTNSEAIYYKDGKHPLFHLPAEAIGALSGALFASLSQADNYLFLVANGAKYGFQKRDFTMNNDVATHVRTLTPDKYVTFDKGPVIELLNMLPVKNSNGGAPIINVSFSEDRLNVRYLAANISVDDSVTVESEYSGEEPGKKYKGSHIKSALQYSASGTLSFYGNHCAIKDGDETIFIAGIFE